MGAKKFEALWDLKDLMAYLKMPKATVKFYVATGKLPSMKLGRHRRFDPDEIQRALKKLSN